MALLDFASGVDANELPSWDDELELPEGWEDEADNRIREHRTADLSVLVADGDGEPMAGEVTVTAFLGDHRLTVSLPEGEVEATLSIDEPSERSVEVQVVDVDVRGNGRGNGRVPVRVGAGDAFDPDDLDYDTVRIGSPDAVNAGGGGEVVHRPGANGRGRGRSHQDVHFDGDEIDLADRAMLRGRTEDGKIVVGFDDV